MIRLAISGIDEQARTQLAARLRGALLVECADQWASLSSNAFNAVALLGANHNDAQAVIDCLIAGKSVLISADACYSTDALNALSAAARKSGTQIMIANPDHYLPSRQLLREQLDAGKLGEVGLVRSHRWMAGPKNEVLDTMSLPATLGRDLEMACSLVGRSPNLVYAVSTQRRDSTATSGRFIQAHLGFSKGAMALVDYGDQLPAGDGYQFLSVIAAHGAAYLDDQQNGQLHYRGGQPQSVQAGEGVPPLANLVQAFIDALAAGRDLSAGVNAWKNALAVLDAAGRSLETGQSVALEENA